MAATPGEQQAGVTWRRGVRPPTASAIAIRIDCGVRQRDAELAPHRIDGRLRRLSDSPSRGE